MSDSLTPATKIKSEERACEPPVIIVAQHCGANIKAEEATKSADAEGQTETKHEASLDMMTNSAVDFANPLFGRAGSVNIKEEDSEEVQVLKAPARSRNASSKSRPRKKVTASKFTEVAKHLQTRLAKDDGVLVDCTYFAQDGGATVRFTQGTLNVFGTLMLRVLITTRSMNKHTTGSISSSYDPICPSASSNPQFWMTVHTLNMSPSSSVKKCPSASWPYLSTSAPRSSTSRSSTTSPPSP